MKIHNSMPKQALVAAILLLAGFGAYGEITIDQISFHDASYITSGGPQNEGGENDNGGAIFVFIRNSGGVAESFANTNITVNGTPAGSISGFKWARIWPRTIQPGEVTTAVIKGVSAPIAEGQTVTVTVTSDGGSPASHSETLTTSAVRIGHVVPSQDYTQLYIFLRNPVVGQSYYVESVFVNGNVTTNCEFVDGSQTIASDSLKIIKVTYPDDSFLRVLRPLALRFILREGGPSGAVRRVGSFIRVTEPIFPLGTWAAVALVQSDAGAIEARKFLHNFIGPGYSQWDESQRHAWYSLRGMDMPGTDLPHNVGKVQDLRNKPGMYGWYIDDEPELSSRSAELLFGITMMVWDNDPVHPTMINNARAREFQKYALAQDHPSMDHYCQFAPLVYNASQYSIKNSFWYTDCLKKNAEPLRIWSYAQGICSVWGTQPYDWGIEVQFWNHLMAGAKGIKWFMAKEESGYTAQYDAIRDLTRQLSLVSSVLLYGDVTDNVTTNHADILGGAAVGEEAMVVIITNSTGVYNSGWFSKTASMDNLTNRTISFGVPSHIAVQQVREVLPSGLSDCVHSYPSGSVTISDIDLTTDRPHRVYLIGAVDATPPSPPTNLTIPVWQGSTAVLSWRESYDNYGVQGYRVFRNNTQVADVRVPLYEDPSASAGDSYYVKAYDGAGNESAPSATWKPQQPRWTFDERGDFGGWGDMHAITAPAEVKNGALHLTTLDTGQPLLYGPDMRLDANRYNQFRIRLYNATSATHARLYWNFNGTKDAPYSKTFVMPQNQWAEITVDMSTEPNWTGTIRRFRFDLPSHGHVGGESVMVDYMELLELGDSAPPTPNPATFASTPAAISGTAISMTATTGTDANTPVEYSFDETSGNPGGTDSGWQTSAAYTDSGLTAGLQYTYTVTMRDSLGNTGAPSNPASAIPQTSPPTTINYPFNTDGDAEGWSAHHQMDPLSVAGSLCSSVTTGEDPHMYGEALAVAPGAHNAVEIRMSVTAGAYGQLFFLTSADGTWDEAKSQPFTLNADGAMHTYTLDMSANVGWTGQTITQLRLDPTNAPASFSIDYILGITLTVDTNAPTPNPATFASPPTAISDTAISMTATAGTDESGPVEYYFDETSGNPGGTDSAWQTSRSYTNSGLSPDTQYVYTVAMRDSLGNVGEASSPTSAMTNLTPEDSDLDGLPDWWEIEHFGDLSQGPDDDPDGDGFTNLQEYQQGTDPADPTDPTDPASPLSLGGLAALGAAVLIAAIVSGKSLT